MRAATVVQVLQDLFYVYCVFYFTCDRSLSPSLQSVWWIAISFKHKIFLHFLRFFCHHNWTLRLHLYNIIIIIRVTNAPADVFPAEFREELLHTSATLA